MYVEALLYVHRNRRLIKGQVQSLGLKFAENNDVGEIVSRFGLAVRR